MIFYQVILIASDTGAARRFLHTEVQSVSGQSRSICMAFGFVSACISVKSTSYIRRLYIFTDSACPFGALYAESISGRRRYSSYAGILSRWGEFLLGWERFHFFSHFSVIDPDFSPWVCRRYSSKSRHLAATCIRAQTRVLSFCKM